MSKGTRNILIIIAIALLVFGIVLAVYSKFKTDPVDANVASNNVLTDANTGLENMLENIFNEENIVDNEQSNTTNNTNMANNTSSTTVEPTEDDNKMTTKEKKAIELVQEEWKKEMGNLKDVSFNVSIQSDGKYGVTVYDTTTTRTIQFYIVDVDTEIVKER